MTEKAQAWGFDLMIATVIFLGALLALFIYTLNLPSEREESFKNLAYEGKLITDSLLTEGYPANWDENTVVRIGILSDGKVNDTKLLMFRDLVLSDYVKTKTLFNVADDYYVYFLNEVMANNQPITGIGQPAINHKNLVKLERIVIQNGTIKNMNVQVWN